MRKPPSALLTVVLLASTLFIVATSHVAADPVTPTVPADDPTASPVPLSILAPPGFTAPLIAASADAAPATALTASADRRGSRGDHGDPPTTPPVTDPPVTDPPTTAPPVTDPPVTDPPTTAPPTTAPPTTTPPTEAPRPVVVYIPGGAGLGFPTEDMFKAWAQPYVDAGFVAVMPHTDINVLPAVLDANGDHQVDDPSVLTALSAYGVPYNPAMPLYDVLGDMALRADPANPVYQCDPYLQSGDDPTSYPLPTGETPCWLFLPQFQQTLAQVRATVQWLGDAGAAQLNIDPARITLVGESSGATVAIDVAMHSQDLTHPPALVVTVAGSYPYAGSLTPGTQRTPVLMFEYAQADPPSIYRPAGDEPVPNSTMVFDKVNALRGVADFVQLTGSGHIPDAGTDAAACVQTVSVAVAAVARADHPRLGRKLATGCPVGSVTTELHTRAVRISPLRNFLVRLFNSF